MFVEYLDKEDSNEYKQEHRGPYLLEQFLVFALRRVLEAWKWNVLTDDKVSVSLVRNVIQKQRVLLRLCLRDVHKVLSTLFGDGLHEPQRVWSVKSLWILNMLQ